MSPATTPAPLFAPATRINAALTASLERRALQWLAARSPRWLTSDQLTALGLGAQFAAGLSFALARTHPRALLSVILCIALNWLGDSLDGTLARVRRQQRPRYGFYVDHIVDVLGSLALMCGLGASGLLHWGTAIAMLLGFLLLAAESYLAACALGIFQLSQGPFGPTEIRLLLIAGTARLLHSPWVTVLGHRLLLFDLGGVVAAVSMFCAALLTIARHTRLLYRAEPLG